jgi:N-acylglucosamine-6-phosphate 2-epimerase
MRIARGLIVSCQGPRGTRLDDPQVMAAMAAAAESAGATAIRAEGVADIRAIKDATSLPVIGLMKRDIDGIRWITPSVDDAKSLADAGSDMVAVDMTRRQRPDGLHPHEMLEALLVAVEVPIVADVSILEEGIVAARGGVAAVLSTLSGYTAYSRQSDGPDVRLVGELVEHVDVPVIAEGRYQTSQQVAQAMEQGAHSVVVGTAITNPIEIARGFVDAVERFGSDFAELPQAMPAKESKTGARQ